MPKFDPKTLTFRDLREIAQKKGKRGYVAQADADGTSGLRHWTQGGTTGRSGTVEKEIAGWFPEKTVGPKREWNQRVRGETLVTEQRMIQRLHEGLPSAMHRTKEERFEALFTKLVETGMRGVKERGYPVWPRSIQDKLTALGFAERNPDIYAQCSALARQLFLEAGHKQQDKDQRKTALDWHGGLNHVIDPRLGAAPSLKGDA